MSTLTSCSSDQRTVLKNLRRFQPNPCQPLLHAPLTNEPYSKIFGEFNPIHVNPYFSDFASLPATITHGLWSSATTRYVKNIVAQGHPDRMIAFNTPLTNEPYSRRLASFGPPRHVFLVRARSGLDQSKTPFSQRKPVFSIRFLLVGVPYHSEYCRRFGRQRRFRP
jgi:MaoC like domain